MDSYVLSNELKSLVHRYGDFEIWKDVNDQFLAVTLCGLLVYKVIARGSCFLDVQDSLYHYMKEVGLNV